jgi:thioredoxin 1
MQRTGVRIIRNVLGKRAYATVPAQEQVVSATFKVQDLNDFNERVKNSKVPVIVDFFAT